MRLIDTRTLRLVEVFEHDAKPYAILSHTWGAEEISFIEMQGSTPDVNKEGYRKIMSFCAQAVKDGYEFGWVDTCCIDKSSSAELSESINSMFRWYRNAASCYAYLSDVPAETASMDLGKALQGSHWFTRGWTLQELIAPSNVVFFTQDWKLLCHKSSMTSLLANITGIHAAALSVSDMSDFSIAQRMSWASRRVTTRSEDIAYCLLGIFDVNMPLLYGEGGEKAFFRLQEELLKMSNDQSLFAWGYPTVDPNPHRLSVPRSEPFSQHLFAISPAMFARFGNVVALHRVPNSGSISLTNRGIRFEGFLVEDYADVGTTDGVFVSRYTLLLDCHYEGDTSGQIGIQISSREAEHSDQHWRGVSDPVILAARLLPRAVQSTIFINASKPTRRIEVASMVRAHPVLMLPDATIGICCNLINVFPSERWQRRDGTFRAESSDVPAFVVCAYKYSGLVFPGQDSLSSPIFVGLAYRRSFGSIIVTDIVIRNGEYITRDLYQELQVMHPPWPILSIRSERREHEETVFRDGNQQWHVAADVRQCCMLGKTMNILQIKVRVGITERRRIGRNLPA